MNIIAEVQVVELSSASDARCRTPHFSSSQPCQWHASPEGGELGLHVGHGTGQPTVGCGARPPLTAPGLAGGQTGPQHHLVVILPDGLIRWVGQWPGGPVIDEGRIGHLTLRSAPINIDEIHLDIQPMRLMYE